MVWRVAVPKGRHENSLGRSGVPPNTKTAAEVRVTGKISVAPRRAKALERSIGHNLRHSPRTIGSEAGYLASPAGRLKNVR
jgi:hypothetical protein